MQSAVIDARKKRYAALHTVERGLRPGRDIERAKLRPKQSAAPHRQVQHKARDPIPAETIERRYEGDTAVLFATGPSLTQEVVDMVLQARMTAAEPLRLFGCNDSYRIVPGLDVHYACDAKWWAIHYERMRDYHVPGGKWTQEPQMSRSVYQDLRRIAGRSGNGLSTQQNLIHFGNNSGYQLINLALLFGIKRMILCGYNMSVIDKKRHFFGDHEQGLNRSGAYVGFVKMFDTIKPKDYGIEIINTTPNSALTAFPKMALEEALKK